MTCKTMYNIRERLNHDQNYGYIHQKKKRVQEDMFQAWHLSPGNIIFFLVASFW